MSATPVIEHPTYFTGLPREYYVDDDVLEEELERIFLRQWLYFCHVSELPSSGSYLTRDILGETVVAARDDDGEIRTFLNVCRHRGYRVCPLGAGQATRFVCPYHRWSYALDGSLLGAPTMPDGDRFDYGDWGLHRVHMSVWHGFVFVCLGEQRPRELADSLGDIAEAQRLLMIEPERLKQVHVVAHEFECNWKIVMENYLECYHCLSTHPELCRIADLKHQFGRPARDAAEYFGLAISLKPGLMSFSTTGAPMCTKLLGQLGHVDEAKEGFGAGFVIQPALTGVVFHIDYGVVQEIRPLGTERAEFINRWFVHEDAQEGEDYEIDSLIDLWETTNMQDKERCEGVQRGVRSRRFVPGPNTIEREQQIRSALLTYLELMDPAGARSPGGDSPRRALD